VRSGRAVEAPLGRGAAGAGLLSVLAADSSALGRGHHLAHSPTNQRADRHPCDPPVGLDEPDENRKSRAEAYALATACTLAGREMGSVPFAGGRIGSRIDEAVKLEPKNPRVRLVEALAMFDRAIAKLEDGVTAGERIADGGGSGSSS
jgi:hypothetical protein